MPRVKRGPKRARRRRKVLKAAKGYYGARSRQYTWAREAVMRGREYAYRDRRRRKRDFRRLWITRISAAAQRHDLSYSRFMHGLRRAEVQLDRKTLARIAYEDEQGFGKLAEIARAAAPQSGA